MVAHHGQSVQYVHDVLGVNSRLDTIQAVVLKAKLKHLDEYAAARNKAADYYDKALANHPKFKTPVRAKNSTHVFHQYTLQLNDVDRTKLREQLSEGGIPAMIYYPIPLHEQNAYKSDRFKKGDFPVTEKLCATVLSLPMHTEMEEETLKYITDNLIQLVNFPTWERMIRGSIKNSILDHIYVNDFSLISDITGSKVTFGDHLLISFVIGNGRHEVRHEVRRSWQNYSKEWLLASLAHVDFGDGFTSVQSCWNVFENSLVEIVDKICPLVPFINNSTVESIKPTPVIKNKINLRKRLLKRLKITKDQQTKNRISQINVEIKNHFYANKRNSVRRGLIPGDSKSLWDTVKRAKDLNCKKIPDKMSKILKY